MTTHGQEIVGELRRLLEDEQITEGALHAMTRIEPGKLAALLSDPSSTSGLRVDEQALSADENARVSILVSQLAYGLEIDDDERLQGILVALISDCGLSLQNVSRLTGVGIQELSLTMDNPVAVPLETKYTLALRASYLINAVSQARAR
ncbi:HTH domain-containing protein [Microbacterium flavescens]|uniref:HTH domain-containing protein n=1 Tax=Microbacterium flavescens TaxID=69366 RepID=UPI001BDEC840|nr:HTH domain-containing protein [Microbacterium flavescens]BFF11455.1 hypothetical protein GCM10025699_27580 [Microbacterium flavescens]